MRAAKGLAVALLLAQVVHIIAEVQFTVLHINDMHARVEGMRGTGGCNDAQNNVSECDGGWARLLTAGKSFILCILVNRNCFRKALCE